MAGRGAVHEKAWKAGGQSRSRALADVALLVALLAAVVPSATNAQPSAQTISGTVRGAANIPLSDAQVILDPMRGARRTRTDGDGRFEFTRVAPGIHALHVIRLGYQPAERTVMLRETPLHLDIELQQVPVSLDTVSIRASRSGIYGTIIARSEFRPIPAALVEVMDGHARGHTAEDGRFDFPAVGPGVWVVRAQRDGFKSRMLSMSVPEKGAVELALLLDTLATNRDRRREVLLREFDMRVHWSATGSALVGRPELIARGDRNLEDAIRYSRSFLRKGMVWNRNACLFVNGIARPALALDAIDPSDVEAVEVYGLNGDWTGTLEQQWIPGKRCQSGEDILGPDQRKFGLQPKGVTSRRGRWDPYVRAIVIWLRQ